MIRRIDSLRILLRQRSQMAAGWQNAGFRLHVATNVDAKGAAGTPYIS